MREAKGMDVKGFSRLSEVSESTLRRIEAGGHEVRIATVRKLARALKVNPRYLARPASFPGLTLIHGGAVREWEGVA